MAFLLKHVDLVPTAIGAFEKYLDLLSRSLIENGHSFWDFVFIRLLIGDFNLRTVEQSNLKCASWRMGLSLNYLLTLVEVLGGNQRSKESIKRRVELAFYRSQIYSKAHKMHKQSHLELNYVIENRESLDPSIT